MTTPFQDVLKSYYPSIYYGYETINPWERPTREEYQEVFQRCVEEHKDLLMDMVREQRREILKNTDMYLLPDYPITDEERARVIEYRQKLRDITKGELPPFTRIDYVLEFHLGEGEAPPLAVSEIVDKPVKVVPVVDTPVELVVDETEPTSNIS